MFLYLGQHLALIVTSLNARVRTALLDGMRFVVWQLAAALRSRAACLASRARGRRLETPDLKCSPASSTTYRLPGFLVFGPCQSKKHSGRRDYIVSEYALGFKLDHNCPLRVITKK